MRKVELECNECKFEWLERMETYKPPFSYLCPECKSEDIKINKLEFEED